METGVHIIVRGVVQGVGFRYYVTSHATKLGVRGYVRNLPDGNVEVEAHGQRSLVEEFISVVKIGPLSAHITDVAIEWKKTDNRYEYFEIW
jgi:acylphosphatase